MQLSCRTVQTNDIRFILIINSITTQPERERESSKNEQTHRIVGENILFRVDSNGLYHELYALSLSLSHHKTVTLFKIYKRVKETANLHIPQLPEKGTNHSQKKRY